MATGHRREHGAAEPFTIDIDTGGTFTDCYVAGGGTMAMAKADTTPHDLSHGVLASIDRAAESLGLDRTGLLRGAHGVRLSTTVATNTFINRNGARAGLLAGAGLAEKLDRLSPDLPLEPSLIATVPDATDEAGVEAVRRATRRLLERGARIIVIALTGSPDLARREGWVRQVIAQDYPRHYLGAVPVLPSHQVTPIADGALRIHTAVLDAYIHPVMSRFLYRVEDQLRAAGYRHPLQVGNANGGTSRVAKTAAIRTWGSGPAGGIAGAAEMARRLGLSRVVAADIGGTSADIGLIVDGAWDTDVEPAIEGVRVSLPALKLESAGIGCGAIVRLGGGDIHVGPESAGALPGPAAFGLGGREATVTDAACCLGYFDPGHFLGGRRSLDLDAAMRVVADKVAAPLGIGVAEAAARIIDRAAARVAAAVDAFLARRQVDPATCALFATGGGGGLLGWQAGARLGADSVYVFPVSPVFSAFGLSRLDILHTYETLPAANALRARIGAMRGAALTDMRGEGVDPDSVTMSFEAEFACNGGVELAACGDDGAAVEAAIRRRANDLRLLRLLARAPGRIAEPRWVADGASARTDGVRSIRWSPGEATNTPVHAWTGLAAGTRLDGPAVLETSETTLLIPPGAAAAVGPLGEVRLVAT